jgi:hypothetical protein
MVRLLCGSLVALALCASGSLRADDLRATVKKLDLGQNTITVTAEDKDQTLNLAKDVKVTALFGKKLKKAKEESMPGGVSAVREGAVVTLTTSKGDNKDVVTRIKIEELQPKKKKKKTNN